MKKKLSRYLSMVRPLRKPLNDGLCVMKMNPYFVLVVPELLNLPMMNSLFIYLNV